VASPPPPFNADQAIYISDADLAAMPLETKIALTQALLKALSAPGSTEPNERGALRSQLSSIVKTLTTPEDFERLFHSVDGAQLISSATDGRRIRKQVDAHLLATVPGDWAGYSRYLDAVTGTVPTTSNSIDFLADGREVIQRLTDDVRAATSSIDLAMYKWEPDEVGLAFANELIAKANPTDPSAPKVTVRAMIDHQGSYDVDPAGTQKMVDLMRAKGVEVIVKRAGLLRDHLDHRKIVVIDGRVGYTGGMNIGLVYRDEWRDQLSRVEGPLVNQLRTSLRDHWRQEGGALREDDLNLSAKPAMRGTDESRVVAHEGHFADSYIKAAYLKAIYTAQKQINIANPYFTDPDVVRALCDAAKRGVQVRVMLPVVNDVPVLRDAARAEYPALLEAGVEVYEYQGRMAHQKIATIDGTWSTFGSSNLDARSLEYNDELNVFSTAPEVARDIDDKMFTVDLQSSQRITAHEPTMRERVFNAIAGLL
jgi:cardiolipin synthase